MFPSSSVSWDNYDTNSQEATTTGATTIQSQTSTTAVTNTSSTAVFTPVTTPPSIATANSGQSITSPICASSPTVANLVRSPSNPSPQSQTVQQQQNFQQNSSSFDTKIEDFSSSKDKLRDLLTHGIFAVQEPDSSPIIKKEPGLASDNILRELLDQEDDGEMGSVANTPAAPASVNAPTTPYDASGPGSVGSVDKKSNNNNMLRMLLNDDDVGKRGVISKNHELVEQLLKDNDNNRDNNNYVTHFKKEQMDSTCNFIFI